MQITNNFATLNTPKCNIDSLHQFGTSHGRNWTYINDAHTLSLEKVQILSGLLTSSGPSLLSEDKDFVVFGSLGRKEFTQGSDVDWTLLVDGAVDANGNMQSATVIEQLLKENNFKNPGPNGPFGNITFSHNLVHFIGGQDDSNHNLTQRCLLMLESDVITSNSLSSEGNAYQRVLKAIVNQYIKNDSGYRDGNLEPHYVPRFLLNDLIRYWRTICVDFANKQIEQDGKKWAVRNFKLRVSRRLIHLKGLLICFECHRQQLGKLEANEYILKAISECPLSYVYSVLSNRDLDISAEAMVKMFEAYNQFLQMMNNEEFRNTLENLTNSKAYADVTFLEARKISKTFHEGLREVLFLKNNKLQQFLINYGIF